jgi:hypothetical protein
MTRKDYIAIASALSQARKYCETQNQQRGVERSALCLSDALAQDNPLFDRDRFLAACGIEQATQAA